MLLLSSLAAAGLLVAGCSSAISGSGGFAGPTATPTRTTGGTTTSPAPTGTRTRDFPTSNATTSTAPTTASSSSSGSASTKAVIANVGEQWMHAYGNGDEATFCALSDPGSLAALFAQKGIADCSELNINWDTDKALQADLQAFAIPDPSKIVVSSSSATIAGANTTPTSIGIASLTWFLEQDGSWKVDASLLSS